MTKDDAKKIKHGQKILIEAIFDRIDEDGDAVIEYTNSVSDCECGYIDPKHIVSIAGETTNTAPAPKYDPCRPFKEGDKVRVKKEVNGRPVYTLPDNTSAFEPDEIWTVVGERENGWVLIKMSCFIADVWHGMLELVTPVEELEPYKVGKGIDNKLLYKNNELYAEFENSDEAERVCNLLNAEHRKEKQQ